MNKKKTKKQAILFLKDWYIQMKHESNKAEDLNKNVSGWEE